MTQSLMIHARMLAGAIILASLLVRSLHKGNNMAAVAISASIPYSSYDFRVLGQILREESEEGYKAKCPTPA